MRPDGRFCSLLCRDLWRLDSGTNPEPERILCSLPTDHPARWYGTTSPLTYITCAECGRLRCTPSWQTTTYCSKQCRNRVRERRRTRPPRTKGHRRHKATLVKRDGWTCWLCGDPIDPDASWPDRLSVTIDHLLPVSRGGTDTADNLGLAHLACNSSRGATDRTTLAAPA